jgi:hypothetical protein
VTARAPRIIIRSSKCLIWGTKVNWQSINAMVFETATHRARLVTSHQGENYWLAERKDCCDDHARRIPGKFATLAYAQLACERDSRECDYYPVASAQ